MPAADTVFDQVLDQIRREFQLIIEKQDLFHLGRSERFAEILFCDIEELYDLIICFNSFTRSGDSAVAELVVCFTGCAGAEEVRVSVFVTGAVETGVSEAADFTGGTFNMISAISSLFL